MMDRSVHPIPDEPQHLEMRFALSPRELAEWRRVFRETGSGWGILFSWEGANGAVLAIRPIQCGDVEGGCISSGIPAPPKPVASGSAAIEGMVDLETVKRLPTQQAIKALKQLPPHKLEAIAELVGAAIRICNTQHDCAAMIMRKIVTDAAAKANAEAKTEFEAARNGGRP